MIVTMDDRHVGAVAYTSTPAGRGRLFTQEISIRWWRYRKYCHSDAVIETCEGRVQRHGRNRLKRETEMKVVSDQVAGVNSATVPSKKLSNKKSGAKVKTGEIRTKAVMTGSAFGGMIFKGVWTQTTCIGHPWMFQW